MKTFLKILNTKDRTYLGINMYKADFEYLYFTDLLVRYDHRNVRASIAVPNMEADRNIDAHGYFNLIKPRMSEFFHVLFRLNVVPVIDCNKMPSCIMTENDRSSFRQYMENPELKEKIRNSYIASETVKCFPVIDIRQDLTAVRCFGLSDSIKQDIRNFKGINDLKEYYLRTVDAHAYDTVYSGKCIDCRKRKARLRSGGCYAFKINEMLKMTLKGKNNR